MRELIAAALIAAAPAPPPRPAEEFTPRTCEFKWGDGEWGHATFQRGGYYSSRYGVRNYLGAIQVVTYTGSWEWDSGKRLLVIRETSGTRPPEKGLGITHRIQFGRKLDAGITLDRVPVRLRR